MNNTASERRRIWLVRAKRFGLRAFVAVAGIAAVLWVTLPIFISTERLGGVLESDLRARNRVDLHAVNAPRLSLWPSPSLTYSDVTVRRGDGSVFFEAERLSAEFSFIEAITGKLAYSDLRLTKPRFHLAGNWSGEPPQSGSDFAEIAMRLGTDMQLGPWPFAQRTFGKLSIRDGSIVIDRNGTMETIVPDVDAKLSWPDPDEPFEGSVNAEVSGQRVQADLVAPQFRRLIAGGNAPMTVGIKLPGASARAEGSASLSGSGFFTGTFSFDAGDIQKLLSWYGRVPKGTEAMKTARAAAQLSASNHVLRFDDLSFEVNDTKATGIMDVALRPGNLPKFTGTLAFADFDVGDINNLLPLSGSIIGGRDNERATPAAALDLRLSSGETRIGEAVFGHVAASMLVDSGHALLDIVDSDFEGGRVTGRLSSGPKGIGRDLKLQLSIRDIDLARLGTRLGLNELWPTGPGSIDVSVSSDHPFIDTRRVDLSGKATIVANEVRLARFNADALRDLTGKEVPFPLTDSGSGGFEANRLNARLIIDKGAVMLDTAELENDTDRLTFTGRVSADDQLALTAKLQSITASGTPPLSIDLGGTRTAPVITAIVSGQ